MSNFSRRDFIKTGMLAALAGTGLNLANAQQRIPVWANLLHLSFNMWEDHMVPEREMRYYRPFLRFDQGLWRELLNKMSEAEMNMVVIDLGDGVRYRSHPEIAVNGAWRPEKLREELQRCRDLGLEPIPKLNFSATHDAWLGRYERMLSTNTYYNVCRELISEVIDLFDGPRFFHLGMDEETAQHQRYYNFVAIRQGELWWHDLLYLTEQVKNFGSRPWVWSDYYWDYPDEFERMPKDVVQSNWFYKEKLDPKEPRVKTYLDLDRMGYDQVPTASNHSNDKNFAETVKFCRANLKPERLLGFLQTPWRPTIAEYRDHHLKAIELVAEAKRKFYTS